MDADLMQAYIENIQRENYSQMMWGRFSDFDWYSNGGITNFFLISGSILTSYKGGFEEISMYKQGFRKGLKENYLLTGRNKSLFGNDLMTETTRPISKFSKWGKGLGLLSFGIGMVLDGISLSQGTISVEKAGLNTSMGAYGLTGIGTIPSLLYFGMDAFYPGGWDGAFKDQKRLYDENKAINPDYQLFPKFY